jgi:energy-coupling factor transporter ATP-binding protein EcfA2
MTGDLFDRLQSIKDRAEKLAEKSARQQRKLETETSALETEILLADALSVLRDVSTSNLSEGKRQRIAGVKRRIMEQIGRAA